VERYITQYIQNLPEASTDPEVLELDSVAVLKSIEAQHGLFVERARGIYSFSHLTFHEYFTARKIVTSCNPYAVDDPTLQMLVSHVAEKRWREVFLLTVGMLESADVLLRLMKVQVDGLLAGDEKLQQFLRWVDEKARSVGTPYKSSAIRAFYFTQFYIFDSDVTNRFILLKALNTLSYTLNQEFPEFFRIVTIDSTISITFELDSSSNLCLDFALIVALEHPDLLNKYWVSVPIIEQVLKALKKELLDVNNHREAQQWWQINGSDWTEQLRAVMIEHRNIGHDWQFSDEQKQLLQQYYDANKLLVDCLNSDCYVSREVRQEIEETLLLSMLEIENRNRVQISSEHYNKRDR
jgi:predicted NACHT family NTPase